MIQYGAVTLRRIESRDMELLRDLINDPQIALSVVDFGFPVSAWQQREWFETVFPNEHTARFIIESGGQSVGSLVVAKIDPDNMTGEVGYKVLREHQGHGYAADAVRALLSHLFLDKGFECVNAYHLAGNIASRKILEKAGFIREGVLRKAVYRNGARADLVSWSVSRALYLQKAGEAGAVSK